MLATSLALGACSRSAPPPDASVPDLGFKRPESAQMFAALTAPLATGANLETACLARIAQATVLARRERDNAPVQSKALAAQVDCRRRLMEVWVERADAGHPGDPTTALTPTSARAEACERGRLHLDALLKLDAAAGASATRRFGQSCSTAALTAAAEANRLAAPKPIGAGDRRTPTCDRRHRDSTCEVVADAQVKAGVAEESCTRTLGHYAIEAACPTENLVGACPVKTGSTWFAYRSGPVGFDDLRARQACEAQGGAFIRADERVPTPPAATPQP
jgi:hypothetical protein